ncbi:MAG: tRNA pseudouridine synthase A, partial [Oribacterium sp.]|nr:tRNA pseudouridine synthase A [Oribacterium sp.]
MKRRIKLTIAYDGTGYKGWQIQNPTKEKPEGDKPTIQGMLTLGIGNLLRRSSGKDPSSASGMLSQGEGNSPEDDSIQLIGASRTDSGVHALGNVAVFDTDSTIPTENFPPAINSFLPEDIRVVKAEEVPAEFNPRFEPHEKVYEYKVDNSPIPSPMGRLYAYNFTYALDIEKMQQAAEYLCGVHDFTSFVNPDSQVFEHGGDAVREIYSIEIFSDRGRKSPEAVDSFNSSRGFEASDLVSNQEQICEAVDSANSSGEFEASDLVSNQEQICEAVELPNVSRRVRIDANLSKVSRKVREEDASLITFRIRGNGFLYHMIRI